MNYQIDATIDAKGKKCPMPVLMTSRGIKSLQPGQIMLVEATEPPGAGDRFIIETLSKVTTPVFLLINKADLVKKEKLLPLIQTYSALYRFEEIIPLSALHGDVGGLIDAVIKRLPEGPQ